MTRLRFSKVSLKYAYDINGRRRTRISDLEEILEEEFRSPRRDAIRLVRRNCRCREETELIVLAGAKVSRPYVILIGLMPTSYNASALFFRAFLPRLPPAAVWRGIAVWKFRRTAGRTCATPRECRPLRRAATANCRATVPLCNFPLLSSLFYRILCPALMKVFPGINVTSNVHGRTICRAPR